MNLNIYLTKMLYQLTTLTRNKNNRTYPAGQGIKVYEDISYGSNRDKKQVLDIFVPETQEESLPVIVQIHGGGWTLGDKKDNHGYCRYLASKGYVTIAMNYTLAPKARHPNQEKIVLQAMTWIHDHIKEYKGNRDRIYLSGDSGGAHLAACTAAICTNPACAKLYDVKPPLNSKQLAGMILFYGAFDFHTAFTSGFPLVKVSYQSFLGTTDIINHKELMNNASPIMHVDSNFPRTIMLSGTVDPLHTTQSIAFAKKLQDLGVATKTVFFDESREEAVHGFMVDYKRKCTIESIEQILMFLKD